MQHRGHSTSAAAMSLVSFTIPAEFTMSCCFFQGAECLISLTGPFKRRPSHTTSVPQELQRQVIGWAEVVAFLAITSSKLQRYPHWRPGCGGFTGWTGFTRTLRNIYKLIIYFYNYICTWLVVDTIRGRYRFLESHSVVWFCAINTQLISWQISHRSQAFTAVLCRAPEAHRGPWPWFTVYHYIDSPS